MLRQLRYHSNFGYAERLRRGDPVGAGSHPIFGQLLVSEVDMDLCVLGLWIGWADRFGARLSRLNDLEAESHLIQVFGKLPVLEADVNLCVLDR